jgi:hypothetical protein
LVSLLHVRKLASDVGIEELAFREGGPQFLYSFWWHIEVSIAPTGSKDDEQRSRRSIVFE